MAGLVSEYIAQLEEMAGYYDELLDISLEKKEIVIRNELEALRSLTEKENQVIGRFGRAERKRSEILQDMALVMNRPVESLDLETLCELIQGPEQAELCKLRLRIREVTDKLRQANDRNKVLIQNSLDYIDFSVNLMRDAVQAEPCFYSATGEALMDGKGFFDARQ